MPFGWQQQKRKTNLLITKTKKKELSEYLKLPK
jgi:hypothetical protein